MTIRQIIKGKRGQTEMKSAAQSIIADGISAAITNWPRDERELYLAMTEKERHRFRKMLKHQADRAAKLLGFTNAWYS